MSGNRHREQQPGSSGAAAGELDEREWRIQSRRSLIGAGIVLAPEETGDVLSYADACALLRSRAAGQQPQPPARRGNLVGQCFGGLDGRRLGGLPGVGIERATSLRRVTPLLAASPLSADHRRRVCSRGLSGRLERGIGRRSGAIVPGLWAASHGVGQLLHHVWRNPPLEHAPWGARSASLPLQLA